MKQKKSPCSCQSNQIHKKMSNHICMNKNIQRNRDMYRNVTSESNIKSEEAHPLGNMNFYVSVVIIFYLNSVW